MLLMAMGGPDSLEMWSCSFSIYGVVAPRRLNSSKKFWNGIGRLAGSRRRSGSPRMWRRSSQLLVAQIGFLCDHVETLYDIDIELKQFAAGREPQLERIAMLNDSPGLIDTLASVLTAHESSLCSTS